MTNHYEVAADALIDVAREEASAAAERFETRLSMAHTIAEKMHRSGLFAEVSFSKCIATADIVLEAHAEFLNHTYASRLNGKRLTGRDIAFSADKALHEAEKIADRVILGITAKRDAARREREMLERQPGQPVADATLVGILQNIEYRERGLAAPTGRDIDAPAPLMDAAEIAARIEDREKVARRDYPAQKRAKQKGAGNA